MLAQEMIEWVLDHQNEIERYHKGELVFVFKGGHILTATLSIEERIGFEIPRRGNQGSSSGDKGLDSK